MDNRIYDQSYVATDDSVYRTIKSVLVSDNAVVAEFKIANCTVYVRNVDEIPNRFHRLMQRLILGITWTVYEEEKDE